MTVHSPRLQNFSGAGSVVLALIDFALNPVVPGLTSADPCVEWRELYPPYRFAAAAKTMANWKSDLEFQDPSHEITVHFQRMPTKRSGLRMGRVASRLSGLSTLRQAATVAMHLAERTPAVSFLCASRLLELREQDVCTLTHYGVNFLNDRALRFIDLAPDTWWLFPVFQVSHGEYRWPHGTCEPRRSHRPADRRRRGVRVRRRPARHLSPRLRSPSPCGIRGPRRGWSAEQGPHGLAATTTTNTVASSARSA